jgi:type I restriction enzyme R subunit
MTEFVNKKFDEAELETAIIELFKQQGYTHLPGDRIHRKLDEILLQDDLRSFLDSRYNYKNLSETEIQKIIGNLENVPSTPLYAGNRETFWRINEGFDLQREDTRLQPLHVRYMDFEEPNNNTFRVVSQYTVAGEHTRRPDLLVFVNGIPIAIFEFKTAVKEDTSIYEAWQQIHNRYARDIPKLLKYCFLSGITDGANARLGSVFTPYPYYYSWNKANDNEKTANGISSLLTLVKGVFAPERLLAILQDFVYYPDASPKEVAIVARYPQFFATQNMFQSIKAHLRPTGDGKGGTYFGATGCGKTYTMLFLARMLILREREVFKNPTIVLITDREDLDTQASELFVASKRYLHETNVRSIESRKDLEATLSHRPSGGVYLTTIQKFTESTGLLSDRENIICISDEAHRSQTGTVPKLKKTEQGVFTTYGFAKYLRDSFPNATYCGFTGTPIDETIAVFGNIVDRYTMKESSEDGITVRIAYEPRLARVNLSEAQAKEIQEYYEECAEEGSNPAQIEASKKAMSKMRGILGHPGRIKRLAKDIVEHYESLCNAEPKLVKKAMVVCADRMLAFTLFQAMVALRPEWHEPQKAHKLSKLNLVATRGENDPKELYELCGTKEYRAELDRQFKDQNSAFKIAIVVDMWITGFDVPSLAVMYIDKPIQKHSLIQTISRVNRVFEGKDKGLVVDYIGIKEEMLKAVKQYGDSKESPVDELAVSLAAFRNHLSLIGSLLHGFDATPFYHGEPLERLHALNAAAEFVQQVKDTETRFMDLSRKLKAAYAICSPSGELSSEETAQAQFYLAIRSIIYKQTKGTAPDAETMNSVVEEMVRLAITCTGIENVVNADAPKEMFGAEFMQELAGIKLPITKFNALLKLLRKSIAEYRKVNKVKALEFDEMLKKVVEQYNNRDNLVFTNEVVASVVDSLSDELIHIFKALQEDQNSFEKLGITYEEKAFYDILVKVRETHGFVYPDAQCLDLAKQIKNLVDDKSQFADWHSREDIKNQLNRDLTVLLYKNGYPPEWDEEVFEKILEQTENFKKYAE